MDATPLDKVRLSLARLMPPLLFPTDRRLRALADKTHAMHVMHAQRLSKLLLRRSPRAQHLPLGFIRIDSETLWMRYPPMFPLDLAEAQAHSNRLEAPLALQGHL